MTTYRSQQLTIEAMKITIENLHEVKKWVGTLLGRDGPDVVIPIPGSRSAHIGEWVVKDGNKFVVMTEEEFSEKYEGQL